MLQVQITLSIPYYRLETLTSCLCNRDHSVHSNFNFVSNGTTRIQ